jgi:UDP-glucose 4-epimerase
MHGENVRDFLYVGDAAEALSELLLGAVTGAVNIGSGEGVQISDLARGVAELTGRPDLLHTDTPPAVERSVVVADVSRLANEVAWRPRYDLRQGLARTVEWWREQLDQ